MITLTSLCLSLPPRVACVWLRVPVRVFQLVGLQRSCTVPVFRCCPAVPHFRNNDTWQWMLPQTLLYRNWRGSVWPRSKVSVTLVTRPASSLRCVPQACWQRSTSQPHVMVFVVCSDARVYLGAAAAVRVRQHTTSHCSGETQEMRQFTPQFYEF